MNKIICDKNAQKYENKLIYTTVRIMISGAIYHQPLSVDKIRRNHSILLNHNGYFI
jgi:hypothetical protein